MKKFQKEDVIKEIETQLTIKSVAKKLGICRQTIYRWLQEDKKFAKDLRKARADAIEDMNDECENRVLNKIMNDDAGMIKFWLRFHHQDYKQSYVITRGK